MIFEIITISVSLLVLILVYFARLKSNDGRTFLFSESFLNKADSTLFDLVKFVFKLYSLLSHNISVFVSRIPHKIAHNVHQLSHAINKKSSAWIDILTHKSKK